MTVDTSRALTADISAGAAVVGVTGQINTRVSTFRKSRVADESADSASASRSGIDGHWTHVPTGAAVQDIGLNIQTQVALRIAA